MSPALPAANFLIGLPPSMTAWLLSVARGVIDNAVGGDWGFQSFELARAGSVATEWAPFCGLVLTRRSPSFARWV